MGEHPEPPLASLSLTHIYYNPEDPLSLICAWLALVPTAVMISYAALFWGQREIELLMMAGGQVACQAVNNILKRLLKEARPKQFQGKGYGMPSSHSQFVAYFAVYTTLWVFSRNRHLSFEHRAFFSAISIAAAAAVASSRIYLSYHTPKQVIVGILAGFVFGILWFAFTAFLRTSAFKFFGCRPWEWVMWVGSFLWVKDMCLDVNLVEHDWRRWHQFRGEKVE